MGNFGKENGRMGEKMKLLIGICTCNRKQIIEYTAKSLSEVKGIEKAKIVIYDDCSDEYDIDFLKKMYPMAYKIVRNEKRLGADYNTEQMYRDFCKSQENYLFNADSDLLFNSNVIDIIEENIRATEKINSKIIFSVFNTPNHKIIKKIDENLYQKESIGAAGVVLSKQVVKTFVETIPKQYSYRIPSIDHFFCSKLKQDDYKILCTQNSYVQHIGLIGQNSFFYNTDWGENFEIETFNNAKAISEVLQEIFMQGQDQFLKIIYTNCEQGRIGIKSFLKAIILCVKYKIKKIKN